MTDSPARPLSARLTAIIAEGVAGWADLPILAGIRSGTLDPALFRNYLEQDYLYLRAYARHYSRLAATSTDDETLEYFVALAHGVVAVELEHHKQAALPFGCDFSDVRPSPETAEYLAFYDGFADDFDGMLVAMLPCIYGYGVALESLRGAAEGAYREWVDIYTGGDYAALVDRHLRLVDDARLPEHRALEITDRALELERRFWNQLPETVEA
ncbi:TenA family protein [Herbiconiux liukaitaii]|uniref:TenA family protein n=1 Tax=Herbiconiux liukaitaii TaxID=3342799 RepID=UPI0035BB9C87